MRLNKFITITSFLTLFSLLYVYQQSEIYRLAYVGQKRINLFTELLDKNTVLRYNMGKNASLVSIGNKIAQGKDYEMPQTYRLVKLEGPLESVRLSQYVYKKETMISRLFGIRKQAEARTINP